MNEPAAATAFDTLQEARTLKDAGVDDGHAVAIVALAGRAMSSLATKADIALLRAEMKTEIVETREQIRHEVRGEIGKLDTKFDAKLDKLDTKLDTKLGKLDTKLDTKLGNLHAVMGEMRAEIGRANWKFFFLLAGAFAVITAVEKALP